MSNQLTAPDFATTLRAAFGLLNGDPYHDVRTVDDTARLVDNPVFSSVDTDDNKTRVVTFTNNGTETIFLRSISSNDQNVNWPTSKPYIEAAGTALSALAGAPTMSIATTAANAAPSSDMSIALAAGASFSEIYDARRRWAARCAATKTSTLVVYIMTTGIR